MTKLNIGVIGQGGRGIGMTGTLAEMEDVRISAICDIRPARLKTGNDFLMEKFGYTAREYTDYHDLIDDPNVDAVFVPSAWENHVPSALYAMRQGKLHQGWQPCIEQLEPYAKVLERRDRCHCRALP